MLIRLWNKNNLWRFEWNINKYKNWNYKRRRIFKNLKNLIKENELKNSSIEEKIKENYNYYNGEKKKFEEEENKFSIKINNYKVKEENMNKKNEFILITSKSSDEVKHTPISALFIISSLIKYK